MRICKVKMGCILVTIGLLGCGSSTVSSSSTPKTVDWEVEPEMEINHVYNLKACSSNPFVYGNMAGYSSEWYNGNTGMYSGSETVVNYSGNVVLYEKDGTYGFCDYEGDILYEIEKPVVVNYGEEIPVFATSYGFEVGYETENGYGNAHVKEDFTGLEEGNGGGNAGGQMLYYWNDRFYTSAFGRVEEVSEEVLKNYVQNGYVLVPEVQEEPDGTGDKPGAGFIVIDEDGSDTKYAYGIEGTYPCVNGMVRVVQDGKYGFVSLEKEKLVTKDWYEDVLWYEEGICPVKKNGKWGFIDEDGNALTDSDYEEVSTVYDGKAYVKQNEKYGILRIRKE